MLLEPTDVVFIAFVLWLIVQITNGGDGGRKSRIPVGI